MSSPPLDVGVRDGIAHVALREGTELDPPILGALLEQCANLLAREEVRALLLVVGGADAGSLSAPGAGLAVSRGAAERLRGIEASRKPTVAALRGTSSGASVEVSLAFHLRTMASDASLALPQLSRGTLPCLGATQRLPRLLGRSRALQLLLVTEPLSAVRAVEVGLVTAVFSDESLVEESRALLLRITRTSSRALALALEAVHEGAELPLEDGLHLESMLVALAAGQSRPQVR